ncbi:hypothetical protein ANACOL_00053 [Anaerotruncus colihominis DSM 17241]|uniref:Uncharacterized protein n=1 Tax=Anaerotruncus colihominis DSM 17241 TaxID=445972 RepID=B0P5N1_9FIRM|nr:hypothetical protein ANACOL_00053 [Anaerotruncus colihominis DSM 17241]
MVKFYALTPPHKHHRFKPRRRVQAARFFVKIRPAFIFARGNN